MPFAFSADEGADVGVDNETTVTEEYKPRGTTASPAASSR